MVIADMTKTPAADTLAGYLPDGTPIHGEYLINHTPRERWGVVAVDYLGWRITMDDDGYFTIANDAGDGETLCDEWHMRDLPTRRAAVSHLLLSDALERLHAAAIAWGRGEQPAPAPAASAEPGSVVWMIATYLAAVFRQGMPTAEGFTQMAQQIALMCTPDEGEPPAVHTEQWSSDESTYTDFVIGDGLTGVLIGTYGSDKPGVELTIGGSNLNARVDQILTLSDVRQLRDNLTAILGDPRLAGVVARAEAGAPSAPVAAQASTIDRTSFHCRVGAATGTLTAILTGMPRPAGERALALLTDLIGVLDGDDMEADDIPALAV